MARLNKTNLGNIAGIVTAVAGAVATVITVAADVRPVPKITVPDLHNITVDEAMKVLTNCGFEPVSHRLLIQEADAQYINCYDSQVVGSNPKSKESASVGYTVIVRYITQDVIDESRKLFNEAEKHKIEVKQAKNEKREQRIERTQKIIFDIPGKAKILFKHEKNRKNAIDEIED